MGRALTRSVSRGHDNELFVLLVDLMELENQLTPLLKAVRVARARHHHVMVVCPWPTGAARPSHSAPSAPPVDADASELVRYATNLRSERAWQTIRRAFGRLGVPVLRAAKGETARLILHRLDQLRAMQGARRALIPLRNAARTATMPLVIVGFGAIGLVSASLFQGGAERWALVPVLIGASGLIFHWRTAPLGLLASVAIGKVLPIWFFGNFSMSRRGPLAADLMLAAGLVAYLMAQYRLLSLTVGIFPSDGRNERATRDPATVTSRELPGALLIVAAATLGAFFLWEVTTFVRPRWGTTGPSWRVAMLVWIISVGSIGLATAIGYWSWRSTPAMKRCSCSATNSGDRRAASNDESIAGEPGVDVARNELKARPLHKECRKAGKEIDCSCLPAFLMMRILIRGC